MPMPSSERASVLVIAEQRAGALNPATWETVAAAQAVGGPIAVAVAGSGLAGAAAELAAADVGRGAGGGG